MRNSRQLVGRKWVDSNGRVWFVDKWVRKGVYEVSCRTGDTLLTGTMPAGLIRVSIEASQGSQTTGTIILDGSTSESWRQMVLEDHAAVTKGANDGE